MSGGWPHKRGGKLVKPRERKRKNAVSRLLQIRLFLKGEPALTKVAPSQRFPVLCWEKKHKSGADQWAQIQTTSESSWLTVWDLIIQRGERERDQAWKTKQTGLKNREAIAWSASASGDWGDLFQHSSKEITNYTLKRFVNIRSALSD